MADSSNTDRIASQDARSTRALIEFAERHGALLRQQIGLEPTERLDPYTVAGAFRLVILSPEHVRGATPGDLTLVGGLDPRTWSGMGRELPDGRTLILINPRQTPERACVTIMEEVAHVHLGHRPTELITTPTGFWTRSYDPGVEQEAYWTAAAALLPSQVVGRAVWKGRTAEDIAEEFGVSRELVEFRIKTLRLWSDRRPSQQEGPSRKAA